MEQPIVIHRPRRFFRWQFGLRTFLVVLTVACVWLAYQVEGAKRQRKAVETIRKYGGWVRYDYEMKDNDYDAKGASWVPAAVRQMLGEEFSDDFFHPIVYVSFVYNDDSGTRADNDNLKPAPLECLGDLPRVKIVLLKETQANDENLKHLSKLTNLQWLYIWDAAAVTDEGVAHLRSLKNLKMLHLSDSQITDKSLEVLAQLPRLERLSLQFNRFSDAGVKRLATLRNLKDLWVCGKEDRPNEISDASLGFLLELPNFEELGVQNTRVTAEFGNRLKAKFPACGVSR
jgi:hypothetical protein